MRQRDMDDVNLFEAERPRLLSIATTLLGDRGEAEDIVQQTWLRLDGNRTEIVSLAAWLTTVATRLCLDRLRARVPTPVQELPIGADVSDPADNLALADTVGAALHVVLERLSPSERVAFVLHDSFGFEFVTIAAVLDTTPAAARKLASRARARIRQPAPENGPADWEVVDAFMAAARGGDLDRLLALLAPGAGVTADAAAVTVGTPREITTTDDVAQFFNGSATAALPVFVGDRPAFAWFHRGMAMVVFDFEVVDGAVAGITFRASADVLATVVRRDGSVRRA